MTTDTCRHEWAIQEADGPQSVGVCRHCFTGRIFRNSLTPRGFVVIDPAARTASQTMEGEDDVEHEHEELEELGEGVVEVTEDLLEQLAEEPEDRSRSYRTALEAVEVSSPTAASKWARITMPSSVAHKVREGRQLLRDAGLAPLVVAGGRGTTLLRVGGAGQTVALNEVAHKLGVGWVYAVHPPMIWPVACGEVWMLSLHSASVHQAHCTECRGLIAQGATWDSKPRVITEGERPLVAAEVEIGEQPAPLHYKLAGSLAETLLKLLPVWGSVWPTSMQESWLKAMKDALALAFREE